MILIKIMFNHFTRYKKPRESSGRWLPMVEPRELVDRTLNLEHSVYKIEH